jgi:[protein-PII] uridylyltransferase
MKPFEPFSETFTGSLDCELVTVSRTSSYINATPRQMRESLNAYRTVLSTYRGIIQQFHGTGGSGTVVCGMLTELIDRFIIHICGQFSIGADSGHPFAVIALGGYGRQELNPYSDVDLLFLSKDTGEFLYSNEISTMIHFLSDINLNIGHSTRTVSECIEAAKEDANFATSLLESRFLAGNRTVWESFNDLYRIWLLNGAGIKLAFDKIQKRNARIDGYHQTVKIQEPNIKESPGGLRDIHTSRWILLLAGIGGMLKDLYDGGFLYQDEWNIYEEHFNFLLRVRNALHFSTGKEYDLLEHIILPDIAKNLSYSGFKKQAAEKFMRDYYMKTSEVFRITNHIIGRFLKRFDVSGIHDIKSNPSGLVLIGEKVGIPSIAEDFFLKHPVFLVRIFAFAGFHGLGISGYAASLIERSLAKVDDDLPGNPEVQAEFREMMTMRKGLGRAFRLMHDHGVLVKLIPEFGDISWHYQYNLYHAYTTDEHSIRVVENLEKMALKNIAAVPELSEIMTDVTAKGALYLAGLLHDTGKGRGASHSIRGERMASAALERLGFDERTIKLVRFLIKEHLVMTHISQRRDIEDDETIKDFIRRVNSTGRLRMLVLLTFADIMALSESSLNDWKKALLLSLYNKAMMYLEKGYETPINHSGIRVLAKVKSARGEPVADDTIKDHLKLLPQQYVRVTSPACIKSHIHGIELMQSRGLWTSFRHTGDVTHLTVIARDKPRALSEICGTITASDISIVGAQIFTRDDGIIIDTFMVVDEDGKSLMKPEIQEVFKSNLRKVITGDITVQELIRTHTIRWKRRRRKTVYYRPRVKICNDISSRYTVLDVFATDYTGLLYDVTNVLHSFGLDIYTAKVGTDEDRVADAFYVQDNGGGKINDEEKLKKLKSALLETLSKACKRK